jgi:tripartite-type tricarboxylate transporter receptor subunit TctC
LADAEASGWNGLFVPAGTPRAIVQKLQADIGSVVQAAAFKAEATDLGYELGGGSADDFSAYIRSEVTRWGKVIKDGNIKAQ